MVVTRNQVRRRAPQTPNSRSTRARVVSALRSQLSSAAMNAAQAAFPQVRPIVRAASMGYNAYRTASSIGRAARRVGAYFTGRKLRSKHTPGIYNGVNAGKFRRSSKKAANKLAPYLKKGFVDTQEVSGLVKDPDCVYLQHSAVDADKQFAMVRKCLLRDLFKKAISFDCENADQVIPLQQTDGTAVECRIVLVKEDVATGSFTEDVVTTAPTTMDTIQKIANASVFDVAFREYAQGTVSGSATNVTKLKYLRCYLLDYSTVGYNWRLAAQIELEFQHVNVYVKSTMKVQNRSLGASGEVDATAVNNNPLIGYKYDFSCGTPSTRQSGAFLLETTGGLQGVSLVRAAQLPQSFKEPPLPRVFQKLTGAAKVKLDPGQVKYGSVYYKAKIPLLKYLTIIGYRYNNYSITPSFKAHHVHGKCQLFAFEDLINVNVNELIQVAYEVNREIAMYLTQKKVVTTIGQFQQFTLDNLPG